MSRINRTTAPSGTHGWVRGIHGPEAATRNAWGHWRDADMHYVPSGVPIWETEAEASREPPRRRRRRSRRVASTHAARTAPEDT